MLNLARAGQDAEHELLQFTPFTFLPRAAILEFKMSSSESPKPALSRRKLLEYWWTLPVGATFGVLGWMGLRAYRITYGKKRPGEPQYVPGSSQKIAPLTAFVENYAAVQFTYTLGDRKTPAVALRLPAPTRSSLTVEGLHYVAFSRVCPHLGCSVAMVRSEETLAQSFNYRFSPFHPVLGCPCHFSVFDPNREGESVFGPALSGLPRVQLEVKDGVLYAVGVEAVPLTL